MHPIVISLMHSCGFDGMICFCPMERICDLLDAFGGQYEIVPFDKFLSILIDFVVFKC